MMPPIVTRMKDLFAVVSKPLFGGAMTPAQMGGCVRLVEAWGAYGWPAGTAHEDEALAYVLATSWHETGRRMQPVREAFGSSDDETIARLDSAWAGGKLPYVSKPYWRRDASGRAWFGRGDVQLTHRGNYAGPLRDAVHRIWPDIDILDRPDAALDPQVSAFLIVEGTTRGLTNRGDYTGWALEDFVVRGEFDFIGARKIVNPADLKTYEPVAAAARHFLAGLRAAAREDR